MPWNDIPSKMDMVEKNLSQCSVLHHITLTNHPTDKVWRYHEAVTQVYGLSKAHCCLNFLAWLTATATH